MSVTMRRQIPLALVSILGILILIENFITINITSYISNTLQTWAVIIASFAVGVGVIGITRIHLRHITRRTKEKQQWLFSIVLLTLMYVVLIAGLFGGTSNTIYSFFFDNIYTPVNATIYALLAFWIVSAAYRAMRAKSTEAIILLVVAFIVMMNDTPLIVSRIPIIATISTWIQDVPSPAGNRGLIITGALGLLIFALRVLSGHFPRALGVSEEI
jgi:positive regulator of sigma E activity